MSDAPARRSRSAATFEDGVDLGAVLQDFPGADKTCRHHERIPCSESTALAALTLYYHPPGGHHAQLVLGVAHVPFAARGGPAAGEKLLGSIGEVVAYLQLRAAGE